MAPCGAFHYFISVTGSSGSHGQTDLPLSLLLSVPGVDQMGDTCPLLTLQVNFAISDVIIAVALVSSNIVQQKVILQCNSVSRFLPPEFPVQTNTNRAFEVFKEGCMDL